MATNVKPHSAMAAAAEMLPDVFCPDGEELCPACSTLRQGGRPPGERRLRTVLHPREAVYAAPIMADFRQHAQYGVLPRGADLDAILARA